jgi:hypothetical protein
VGAFSKPLLKTFARMRNGIGRSDAAGVEPKLARFRGKTRLEVKA